jgi:hypothetical protein
VIFKYIIFLFFIFTISISFSIFIKPIYNLNKIPNYKETKNYISDIYSKILFSEISKNKETIDKFRIIERIINYNMNYKEVYLEICSNINSYYEINRSRIVELIEYAVNKYKEDKFIDCYIQLLSLDNKDAKAISFLQELYDSTRDPYQKGLYLERINFFQNKINIITIANAVELYYQKYKSHPYDLHILVDERFLDEIPIEPYGGQYFIASDGQVKSTIVRGDYKNE